MQHTFENLFDVIPALNLKISLFNEYSEFDVWSNNHWSSLLLKFNPYMAELQWHIENIAEWERLLGEKKILFGRKDIFLGRREDPCKSKRIFYMFHFCRIILVRSDSLLHVGRFLFLLPLRKFSFPSLRIKVENLWNC